MTNEPSPQAVRVEQLGRFGHHPDPAIDFCVEVECIEGLTHDAEVGLQDAAEVKQRAALAMTFRVGGDPGAIAAKDILRRCEERINRLAASPALAAETGGEAVADIIAERRRQVEVEGWTPEHDDEHDDRSLALAAACYAIGPSDKSRVQAFHEDVSGGRGDTPTWSLRKRLVPIPWPESWDPRWWKPSPDRRRNLIKAGALIVAEIERLDRKGASK